MNNSTLARSSTGRKHSAVNREDGGSTPPVPAWRIL